MLYEQLPIYFESMICHDLHIDSGDFPQQAGKFHSKLVNSKGRSVFAKGLIHPQFREKSVDNGGYINPQTCGVTGFTKHSPINISQYRLPSGNLT